MPPPSCDVLSATKVAKEWAPRSCRPRSYPNEWKSSRINESATFNFDGQRLHPGWVVPANRIQPPGRFSRRRVLAERVIIVGSILSEGDVAGNQQQKRRQSKSLMMDEVIHWNSQQFR